MAGLLPVHAELRDPAERLSADDQATQREAEFLQHSMLRQQQRVALAPVAVQGVCTNCGDACLPLAVYCDEDCRADHEFREGRAR